MALWKHYHVPSTLDEALDLLARYQGQARVIAGGTDLLLDMQHGGHPSPEAMVDVSGIEGFKSITLEDDQISVGAGATHSQIVQTTLLSERAPCLVEGGGNVVMLPKRHTPILSARFVSRQFRFIDLWHFSLSGELNAAN